MIWRSGPTVTIQLAFLMTKDFNGNYVLRRRPVRRR
jgi:hypothetical protein